MASNFSMSLAGEGLLSPGALATWRRESRDRLIKGTARAMREHGKVMAVAANTQVRSAMNIKRKNFPNIKGKVYASRPDVLPALRIYSGVPWLGLHGRGGVIEQTAGRGLLIPLVRIGFAAFQRVVSTILRNGAGFWKKINGRVFLMAEYQAEYGQPLARFRRLERANRGGQRIRGGDSIPIAMLVGRVTIRKRFDMKRIVSAQLPGLARAIEQSL